MELWGGHECTVNRVGESYRDQTRLTGHDTRIEDLEKFAALGIVKLRYPALWERIAPARPDARDWRWTDERIGEISRLGMQPILGLLHHGSGPRYTNLVSDDFVPLFAGHAAATAQRYPHVQDWTPINEPLTTARFSALYGHWYPHRRSERSFWEAVLNQIEATTAAMRAIRVVNSDARLIQSEDLGQYYSTAPLAGVADHFNARRWATWDLLTGRLTRDHDLWPHLCGLGFEERLHAIADDPCPPDIVGVNFYPTSERFLDHRLDAYPYDPPSVGYHDVTAARVLHPSTPGLAGMLRQAWSRYGLPMAVTECHLGCSREEQLRWLWQCWQTCHAVRDEGADVRALTAWALLGNMDWNSLITVDAGHYEPGAFDVRGGTARPTAVADLLRVLGSGAELDPASLPALAGRGWWERDIRLEHAPFAWAQAADHRVDNTLKPLIVVTGATGTLAKALVGECALRGLDCVATDRAMLPIDDRERVASFLDERKPWAVVNAAGWVRVDDAEHDPKGCFRANSVGAEVLATACAARGIHCTLFSSDLVFDGTAARAYRESDAPNPLGVYGESKGRAERVLHAAPGTLVIRTAAFFSPHDPYNFAMAVEAALRAGQSFAAAADVVSPTYVPDLVRACLDLVVDGERGLWHLTNGDAASWVAFGRMIADAVGLDGDLIIPTSAEQLGWRAARPRHAPLASHYGRRLPPLADAIARYADVRRSKCE